MRIFVNFFINIKRILGILLFIVMGNGSYVYAKEINIIAGLTKSPFIIKENESGLQIELIREILSRQNIDVKFTHTSLLRNLTTYQSLNADGISILAPDFSYPNIYTSLPYISYQNVAVSLTESTLKINDISDLSGKSVVAFEKASKFLGDEYRRVVGYSLDYREVAGNAKQVEMLFMRESEVIVIDRYIFTDVIRFNKDPLFNKTFTIHPIFEPTPYVMGFRSKDIRDKFNLSLQAMQYQGEYQKIIDAYLH